MKVISVGDQRFYPLPDGRFLPSVTTKLAATFPKSKYLIDWQIEKGKEEAERILEEAGRDGTSVHEKIERMLLGFGIDTAGLNQKEAKCLLAFKKWYDEVQPKIIGIEVRVDNLEDNYAGTIDLIAEIDGVVWIIDFKTSKALHDSHQAQVCGYGKAYSPYMYRTGQLKTALLHLNAMTKKGYTFKEVDTKKWGDVWDCCSRMFELLYPNAAPKLMEVPDVIELDGITPAEINAESINNNENETTATEQN
jgi:hypothetical protein